MIQKTIEKLLAYSQIHLGLMPEDETYFRNILCHLLDVNEPSFEEVDKNEIASLTVPDSLTKELNSYLKEKGFDDKTIEKKIVEIYGTLSPLPSVVIQNFNNNYKLSPKHATDYFYDLSIKNDYVKKSKIAQNVSMKKDIDNHDIEVTINLSKPEKNNKDIAKLVGNVSSSNYPSCVICIENEGCNGSSKTPPRNNLRLIPLEFGDETWYLQYSPYGYYNEHCILIKKEHVPMEVKKSNIKVLFDFVDMFPHYFIGSNSDLPIVGGSILNHEHFQGGNYELPLMRAKNKEEFVCKNPAIRVYSLDWPGFVMKFESKSKKDLLDEIDEINQTWFNYSDESVNIIANDGTRHNTSTLIVNKKENIYYAYLILRNNNTNKDYPDGIFHVRKEYQPIKQEGIGLIEAMGLFILPARLKRQLALVNRIINKEKTYVEIIQEYPDMVIFENLINGINNGEFKDTNDILFKVCDSILSDISVFKNNEKGLIARNKFLKLVNLCK